MISIKTHHLPDSNWIFAILCVGNRLGYVVTLLLLYGWAVIPLVYLFSFLFTVASTAFIRLTIFNVITGLATLLTVFILSLPALDLLDVADALKWVFIVLPNYALGQALNDMFTNHKYIGIYNQAVTMCVDKFHFKESVCENLVLKMLKDLPTSVTFQTNYLAWASPGIGRYLVFLSWEGLFFFLLVLYIEYGGYSFILSRCKRKVDHSSGEVEGRTSMPMDEDVAAEMQRIDGQVESDDVLVLDNVSKYYGTIGKRFLAVDRISLGIPRGECFGLLGLNGAGKTTTFKMITGDEGISEGSINVDGYNISTDMSKVGSNIALIPFIVISHTSFTYKSCHILCLLPSRKPGNLYQPYFIHLQKL